MIEKIDHLGIVVKSLDQALKTYKDILGLEPKVIEEHEAFGARIAFIPVGETLVELIEALDEKSDIAKLAREKGEHFHHIAYRVTNIDKILKDLKDRGVGLVHELAVPGGAGSRIALISAEFTGNIVTELVERDREI